MLGEPHIIAPYGTTVRRYADILNDRLFKRILGAERNKEALIEILRLLIPERDITDIHYDRKKRKRNPFTEGHDAVFDVECTDRDGARFVVEMQQWHQDHFYGRALFYSTFPLQEQVPRVKGDQRVPHDRQYEYPPVYVVSLMAFHFHNETDKLLYRYELQETESGERMTDRLTFIFLEMDKVKDEPGPDADVLKKLCWAFMNMSTLRERPAALLEKVFRLIFEACELESYESDERTEIIDIMTTERDKRNIAYTYWAEGKEEGLVQGREEGKTVAVNAVAKRLAAMGLGKSEIAKATGLTEDETALILGGGEEDGGEEDGGEGTLT